MISDIHARSHGRLIASLLFLLSLFATSAAFAAITFNPTSLSIAVGSSATTRVSGVGEHVRIRSGNTAIATASYRDGTLRVSGVAVGSTTIRVTSGETSASLPVTVVPVARLAVTPTSLAVAAGATATASISGSVGSVSVRSLNAAVATASLSGSVVTVRGVAAGTTTIRISDSRQTVSLSVTVTSASALSVSPTSLTVAVGATAAATVSGAVGTVTANSANTAVATATVSGTTVTVRGVATGSTTVNISDGQRTVQLGVVVTTTTGGGDSGIPFSGPGANYVILGANDLGMHCTDTDFQVFSILPPFNSMHTQVIQKGTTPTLVDDSAVDVYYAATSNANDPVAPNSINTTSANSATVFKTNFWQLAGSQTVGSLAYRVLYPAQNCGTPPCPSVLDLFAPMPADLGLPVPDPNALPGLVPHQQTVMSVLSTNPFSAKPYGTNTPQPVLRFDANLAFFPNFPFGGTMNAVNWFSADGIPMTPIDDAGRVNAYPMARIAAVTKGASPRTASNVLAAQDIVLPVAREANCQTCHAALSDQPQSATTLTGLATDFANDTVYANGTKWAIATTASTDVPGPEKLLNAAKVNILRLHDAKHGASYIRIDTGAPDQCLSGTEASCLDKRRTIQCSQCHYSPALDLAQVGPIDEPTAGRFGRQQTRHRSQSSVLHGYHGSLKDASGSYVFPDMPAPGTAARASADVGGILVQSCYSCHPGQSTKCLRGAMFSGGVVCQDCHGSMRQVGNDFTANFPSMAGQVDLSRRVPWANEPKCQSCHIGDAVSVQALNKTGMIVAADGIRLLQAYTTSAATQAVLANITSPGSRFAEGNSLYRLSNGHGGVMCKACHGSTHAEWPIADANANDNVAATQLQGHTGTIIECGVCHSGSVGTNLNGPHGMHVVNNTNFANGGHENLAQSNPNACRACHGQRGEGTVLSRVAADRVLNGHSVSKGTPVTCGLCHNSPL